MLKFRPLFLAVTLLLFINTSRAQEITGSGIWTSAGITLKLNKKLDYHFESQIRTLIQPFQWNALLFETGFNYSLNKKFETGCGYRNEMKNQKISHRVTADISFRQKIIKNFDASLRIRYQHERARAELSTNYIRPKLTLKYKMNKKLSPYLSEEFFCYFGNTGTYFNEVRTETGMNFDLKNNFEFKIGYMFSYEFNTRILRGKHVASFSLNKTFKL